MVTSINNWLIQIPDIDYKVRKKCWLFPRITSCFKSTEVDVRLLNSATLILNRSSHISFAKGFQWHYQDWPAMSHFFAIKKLQCIFKFIDCHLGFWNTRGLTNFMVCFAGSILHFEHCCFLQHFIQSGPSRVPYIP